MLIFIKSSIFSLAAPLIYSSVVDPDSYWSWLQQFWATATLQVINDVPHIRAKVAGKKILISEATIRADLLFDDENGVDCFLSNGSTRSMYLLHCLCPKSTSWDNLYQHRLCSYVILVRSIVLNTVRGIADLKILCHQFSLPSKVFTFMRKHSTKFSCKITPLTPSMLEVVTALAAEEEQSTSPHSRAASYARDAHSQRAAHSQSAALSQGTAELQRTADFQGTDDPHDAASIPKSPNDYTPTDISAVTPEWKGKVMGLKKGTITPRTLNFEDEAGPSSPLRPIQVMDSEELHNAAEVLVSISRPRGLSIPGPIQSQPQQPTQGTDTQGTDPKDKGKGILVEEPKKKKLTLQQIRALETTNDEEVARKIQAEWDAEEERKRERKGELKERDVQRLSRKRKATVTEAQPSKKPKLRSETIDELRNYLRL
ncbi:hypothetical protein Tco_0006646 [Tanacetum coccineum]